MAVSLITIEKRWGRTMMAIFSVPLRGWREDYKYNDAVRGFSYGFTNPVPLAWVAYSEIILLSVTYKFLRFGRQEHREHVRYVSFINGITRTIWLLSHG